MQEDKKPKGYYGVFFLTVMFFITVLFSCLFSFLKGLGMAEIIRNTVMIGIGSLALLMLFAQAREKKAFDYDNGENPGRFLVIYLFCLVLASSCGYLPAAGWPFLAVFVVLSLFSNTLIGICAGTVLLAVSVLLSGSGIEIFLMYFLCGVAGSVLFRGLDQTYRIGIPLAASLLLLLTAETACVVLYENEHLKFALFQIPLLNVLISLILLLIILKIFSAAVIFRYRDKYMEINDPECALLVELKNKSKEEYYQAVHTAYFCDRIARRLDLDADALKAGGYYHRIGLLSGENTWEEVEKLTTAYHFPPAVNDLLKEYLDRSTTIKSKETAVLMLSDAVVSSMLFLFARNQGGSIDYNQVIETVFKKKLETPLLWECTISMEEITRMKNLFKEEKLYYDFLR